MARTTRRLRRWRGAAAKAAGIALVALAGAHGCQDEIAATDEELRPVRVHEVASSSAIQKRMFPGKAQASTEAELSFKVSGQIRRLGVAVGTPVRSGQLIAELDDTDLQLELRQREASYAEASAQERNASSAYARTKILFDAQSASSKQLESDRANAESARANLRAQAQAVALAKSRIDYTRLYSPEDGLIASVPVAVNENVNAGEAIAVLNFGERPEVAFNVPEFLIGSVSRLQPANVRFSALGDEDFAAEIIEVGVAAGRTAYPVTASLMEPDPRVRAGMAAEVTLDFSRDEAGTTRIFVPAFAVAEDAEGRFAFVAVGDPGSVGTIERRPVTIGVLLQQGLEVTEGLEPGELVVTAGIRFIEPGMSVRILEP